MDFCALRFYANALKLNISFAVFVWFAESKEPAAKKSKTWRVKWSTDKRDSIRDSHGSRQCRWFQASLSAGDMTPGITIGVPTGSLNRDLGSWLRNTVTLALHNIHLHRRTRLSKTDCCFALMLSQSLMRDMIMLFGRDSSRRSSSLPPSRCVINDV